MDRAQKAEAIETLKGVLESSGAVVVTHYNGSHGCGNDRPASAPPQGRRFAQGGEELLVQKALDGVAGVEGGRPLQRPRRHRLWPGRSLRRQGRDPSTPRTTRSSPLSAACSRPIDYPGQGPPCRRWRRCRPWTSSAASSSDCSTPPRPVSPAWCRLRRLSSPASSARTQPKTRPSRSSPQQHSHTHPSKEPRKCPSSTRLLTTCPP